MEPLKYYYEFNKNRELPEEERGYAFIVPLSAKDQGAITNHLVQASVMSGKKGVKLDMANKSLEINKKRCPTVFNVKSPMGDQAKEEMSIQEVYEHPFLSGLYEELSNAVGDIDILAEGIKKN